MTAVQTRQETRSGSLDLVEEISDAGTFRRAGCERWPSQFRLLSSRGEVVKGRCRSSNKCAYCARLGAIENSEMLQLDALHNGGPEVWCVLTTRTVSENPKDFYEARRQVFRALKRRWPDAQYACLLEFTTGYGTASGGKRRPHWNLLLKGIPASAIPELTAVVIRVWCGRVDAEPQGQHVGAITESGGLMRYLAMHFQKESQSPPEGWTGHRFIKSRGYFGDLTAAQARAQAKDSLADRRVLRDGIAQRRDPAEIETMVEKARQDREQTKWALTWIYADDGEPKTPLVRGDTGVWFKPDGYFKKKPSDADHTMPISKEPETDAPSFHNVN